MPIRIAASNSACATPLFRVAIRMPTQAMPSSTVMTADVLECPLPSNASAGDAESPSMGSNSQPSR